VAGPALDTLREGTEELAAAAAPGAAAKEDDIKTMRTRSAPPLAERPRYPRCRMPLCVDALELALNEAVSGRS
jgi:hypothetical protein